MMDLQNTPTCLTCVKKAIDEEVNAAEKASKEYSETYNDSSDKAASSSKDGDVEMKYTSPVNKEREKDILQSQETVDKVEQNWSLRANIAST